jgi:hypothetical protein
MSIFYFEMQGLKEKQKKSEKLGLFVVCMHTWRSPVHCTTGWVCMPRALLCELPAGRTATSNATAHGKAWRMAMP